MSGLQLLVALAAMGASGLTDELTVISGGDLLSVAGATTATDKDGNAVVGLALATYTPPVLPPPA